MAVRTIRITVFVVWELDPEIGNEVAPLRSRQKTLAETRKRQSSRVVRRRFDVTVQTDVRHRPFARKELLPVTAEARFVFRVFRHIRKSVVRLPRRFPVLRRKHVARITSGAMFLGEM